MCHIVEAGTSAHGLDLTLRIGVAGWSRGEHGHGEHAGAWRRNAIIIDRHLYDRHLAPRLHGGVNFLEQANIGRDIEVVDEVGDQHRIVAGPIIGSEGTAFDRVPAVGHPELDGILMGDR
jgi:hypothetical protein